MIPTFLFVLAALILAGALTWRVVCYARERPQRRFTLFVGAGAVLAMLALFRWAFPETFNYLVYRGLYANSAYLAVTLLAAGIVTLGVRLHLKGWNAWPWVTYVLALGLLVFGSMFVHSLQETITARHYRFQPRNGLLETDPRSLRYTPLEVAHRKMRDTLPYSEFKTEFNDVRSVNLDSGVGFQVPIRPDGTLQEYIGKNRGFVTFDDRPTATESVVEVVQTQEVGQGMMLFDNIWRVLYNDDPFCVYRELYYSRLTDEPDAGIVYVAPKTVFRMHLPLIFVEELESVTVVYSDGRLKRLTLEEAQTKLVSGFIYPTTLTRTMVEAQRFDQGVLSGWYRRPGKIKIPQLPGRNQMPFRIKARDNRWYDVIAAEPDGEANALFRIYYIDILTGDRSVLEYGTGENYVGPRRALEYVKAVEGFVWYEENGGGTFRIVEPRYLTRVDDKTLYFMVSVTTRDFTGVVATVCIDTKTTRPYLFRSRQALIAWAEGGSYEEPQQIQPFKDTDGKLKAEMQELRKLADDLSRRLKAAEESVK